MGVSAKLYVCFARATGVRILYRVVVVFATLHSILNPCLAFYSQPVPCILFSTRALHSILNPCLAFYSQPVPCILFSTRALHSILNPCLAFYSQPVPCILFSTRASVPRLAANGRMLAPRVPIAELKTEGPSNSGNIPGHPDQYLQGQLHLPQDKITQAEASPGRVGNSQVLAHRRNCPSSTPETCLQGDCRGHWQGAKQDG